mgnify:CR=1 FL=1|tara:strand:- start:12 stop:974 length:963 start_codon:yes stop_codon:yes gene_type:complete
MINQIALINSYCDEEKLKTYDFSHFIYSYNKEKLLELSQKGHDNTIFYISNSYLEFNNIFFKMGFLYNIFKKNDFKGIIKINGIEYKINNFIDYFSLFEFKNHFYLNAIVNEKKYSFTFIDYNRKNEYFDILVDFINFDNTSININFIYRIDLNLNHHKKILNFYTDLMNFKNDFTTPLLSNFNKTKLPKIKLPPLKKEEEFLPKRINISLLPPLPLPRIQQPNNKNNKRVDKLDLIEDILGMMKILNNDKINKFQPLDLPIDKSNNSKIIEINTMIHKKIINNFHRLKISEKNNNIQKEIIKETIDLLNESICELKTLV